MHMIRSMMTNSPPQSLRISRLATQVVYLVDGVVFATWVTRIPEIQERLELSNAALGLALLLTSLGGLITMPVMGWWVARFGSRLGSLVAMMLFAVTLPLLALAEGVTSLSLVLLAFGAGFGAMNIAANAQAVSVEKLYGRPIMSSFHAMFSLGGILGALVGGIAAATAVTPLVHFASVGLLAGVLALSVPRFLVADTPVLAETGGGGVRIRQCVLLGIIAFCSMLGEGAMADWSAAYLHQIALATPASAAMGFAAFSLMMTVGRFLGDRITMRVGADRTVRLGGVLVVFGILLSVLFPSTVPATIGFAFVGAGLSCVVPTVFSAVAKIPGVAPAVAIATVSTIGYFGFLCGPPIIGFAADLTSLRWAMLLVLLAAITIFGLSRSVAAPSKEQELPAEEDPSFAVTVAPSPAL
jgi:MFS family permease